MVYRLLITSGITALLIALSALLHYEVLRLCDEHLGKLGWVHGRAKVVLATAAAFCSHLLQMALFAAAYWAFDGSAMGSLKGVVGTRAFAYLYFSAESYTSLGLGDVFPVGEMRLVAGLEALTGLLMIGWSTSFTYLEMRRHWLQPRR